MNSSWIYADVDDDRCFNVDKRFEPNFEMMTIVAMTSIQVLWIKASIDDRPGEALWISGKYLLKKIRTGVGQFYIPNGAKSKDGTWY